MANILDDFIDRIIKQGKTWKTVVNGIYRNQELNNVLIKSTSFLPTDASLSMRLYCYKENIVETPVCPECGTPLEFTKITTGFKTTCGHCGKIRIQIPKLQTVSADIETEITEYRKFALSDNKIRKGSTYESVVKSKFPGVYHTCKGNNYKEKLYMFIYGIQEQPKCPVCGSPLPLRSFAMGFQETCSKECQAMFFKQNRATHEKISSSMKARQSGKNTWLYGYDYELDGNYTIFKNYCEHGNARVYSSLLNKIRDTGEATMCMQCNYRIYSEYTPSENEIKDFIDEFPEFYKSHANAVNWDFWMRYYPKKLKMLVSYFEKHIRKFNGKDDLPEVYYTALHKMTSLPKCPICGAPITTFHKSTHCYATHCNEHLYEINSSVGELELKTFIESLGFHTEINRDILSGQEIDCYIPELKIGFEYNGCYFHSSECKAKDYHYKKKEAAAVAGVDLYFIWEDNWQNQKAVIQSLIKSKLGCTSRRVYARKCEIREIGYAEAKDFLTENHLHGYCVATYKLGLFYENELVAVMTLGKSRFNKDEMEIIRFANKLDTTVIGAASKLFRYFQRKYLDNRRCISFAHNDISNGNMYERLGFVKESVSESWSWLYKGIRYNRLNKVKDSGEPLLKCYSSGVTKYVFRS